jgi:hypothetical protein
MTMQREIVNRIGSEVIYLLNTYHEIAVKIVPLHQTWYAKAKGGEEFEIHCSTDLACETISLANRISKYDYETF